MKNIFITLIVSICIISFVFAADVKNAIDDDGLSVSEYKKGLYIVKIDPVLHQIVPYVADGLATNSAVFKNKKPIISINAGYFDPKNQKTTSYVMINSVWEANPLLNENLMQNRSFANDMAKVLNRSEFRVMDCNGKKVYDIQQHNTFPPLDCTIIHSIQAGPEVVPIFKAEEEFFTQTFDGKITRDPIGVGRKYARTAIALKDEKVYLIIATNEHPMSLYDLKDLGDELNFDKVLNLDGGGSTSFNYKDIEVVSDKDSTARRLKSFILVY